MYTTSQNICCRQKIMITVYLRIQVIRYFDTHTYFRMIIYGHKFMVN